MFLNSFPAPSFMNPNNLCACCPVEWRAACTWPGLPPSSPSSGLAGVAGRGRGKERVRGEEKRKEKILTGGTLWVREVEKFQLKKKVEYYLKFDATTKNKEIWLPRADRGSLPAGQPCCRAGPRWSPR